MYKTSGRRILPLTTLCISSSLFFSHLNTIKLNFSTRIIQNVFGCDVIDNPFICLSFSLVAEEGREGAQAMFASDFNESVCRPFWMKTDTLLMDQEKLSEVYYTLIL